MRTLLTMSLFTALAAPGAALAQEATPGPDTLDAIQAGLSPPAVSAEPQLITLPAQPGPAPDHIPPPLEAQPVPQRAEIAPALDPPTTIRPIVVEATAQDDGKVERKVGTIAGGVIGGLAGAAVAGPVGKIAGSLVGKTLAKGIVGDGKDKEEDEKLETAEAARGADEAAMPTAATQAAPPPLSTVSGPEAETP
ncbi:hypothetical protein [uncultured Phenylobacterium sp.]|uniref:hypothetical protein n=1 Tax=uncultured Phenylobacterium sp. TaxID=349273 RepID=UPI0025F61C45|nr:hypothetical protein [uncultured Phenylobacterium sp.]